MDQSRQRVIRAYWTIVVLALIATVGGIAGLDAALARWTATLPESRTIWDSGTALLDMLVLKEISNFLLGFLLLLIAGGLLLLRRTRPIGWPLLYVASVQFASTIIADLAKPQFGRLRPFEAAANPGAADTWVVGANSFPSGHVAFYAGLFLPLMLLAPRWAGLLAIPPLFIAAARLLENDHYLSDVAVSFALASLLAIAFRFILERT
jgi:membrane-associated phospholipid phosphatase